VWQIKQPFLKIISEIFISMAAFLPKKDREGELAYSAILKKLVD